MTATVDRRGPKGARGNPALHTSITLPAGQASIRTATVALPSRLTLDLPAIKAVCTSDQAAADACPSGSIVGTVSAITPLLATGLSGPVNMVQIPGSLFPGLRLSLNGPTPLRLTGTLGLTKGIAASFDGLPDVPLSNFDLTFVGGGPLKLFGPACGKALKFTAQLTGHNGATVTRTATATIPNCPATAAAALSKGTRPRLRLKLDHGRDAKPLSRAVVTLPKGLTARKGAGRVALLGDGKRLARPRGQDRAAPADADAPRGGARDADARHRDPARPSARSLRRAHGADGRQGVHRPAEGDAAALAQRLWLTTSTLCPSGSRTNAP